MTPLSELPTAKHGHVHQHIKSLDDLRPRMAEEIHELFVDDNRMRDREFKPLETCGAKPARNLIEKARAALDREGK